MGHYDDYRDGCCPNCGAAPGNIKNGECEFCYLTVPLKTTDWFPPELKPVHPGVYELEYLPYPYLYWTGKYWCLSAGSTPEEADVGKLTDMEAGSYTDECRWRGVAK